MCIDSFGLFCFHYVGRPLQDHRNLVYDKSNCIYFGKNDIDTNTVEA